MARVWAPPFFLFLLAFCAFVLLVLITFSTPIIPTFYFLEASIDGGVIFGPWGWCSLAEETCSPVTIGYRWDPQLIYVLTKASVLYPISAFFTLATSTYLLRILYHGKHYRNPYPLLGFHALIAFLTSASALGVSTFTWTTALSRFHDAGIDARVSSGLCIWMSTGATTALLLVMINTTCGTLHW